MADTLKEAYLLDTGTSDADFFIGRYQTWRIKKLEEYRLEFNIVGSMTTDEIRHFRAWVLNGINKDTKPRVGASTKRRRENK